MSWRARQNAAKGSKAAAPTTSGEEKTVRIKCPSCQNELTATPGGPNFACPKCNLEMKGLPKNFTTQVETVGPPPAVGPPINVGCPSCSTTLSLVPNGAATRCPSCRTEFNAPPPGTKSAGTDTYSTATGKGETITVSCSGCATSLSVQRGGGAFACPKCKKVIQAQ